MWGKLRERSAIKSEVLYFRSENREPKIYAL